MLVPLAILLLSTEIKAQTYGPFFLPNGTNTDPIFVTFGEYNTTHFFINIFSRGDHWFGFGFASGSGCTPSSTDCYMSDTDAIIVASNQVLTAKEYILGNHSIRNQSTRQNLEVNAYIQYVGGVFEFSASIRRPYNPELYGDPISYKISYPLAGGFCFLWTQGSDLIFTNSTASGHINRGFKCINFGGTTAEPTIAPITSPTDGPVTSPTVSVNTPSSSPSHSAPTNSPSSSPSHSAPSNSPSYIPTQSPSATATLTIMSTNATNAPVTVTPTPSPTPMPTEFTVSGSNYIEMVLVIWISVVCFMVI